MASIATARGSRFNEWESLSARGCWGLITDGQVYVTISCPSPRQRDPLIEHVVSQAGWSCGWSEHHDQPRSQD